MTSRWTTAKAVMPGLGIALGLVLDAYAQPRLRQPTATEAQPVALARAAQNMHSGTVEMLVQGNTRIITSNGVPTHKVGRFQNPGNPNRISGQSHRFEVPVTPRKGRAFALPRGASFGVAVNGMSFDAVMPRGLKGRMGRGFSKRG